MMKKLAIFGSILALLTLGAAPVFSAAKGATMGNPKGIAGYTFGAGYFMNYDYLAGSPSSLSARRNYGNQFQAISQSFGYGGFALTVHPYAGAGYMGSLGFQMAKNLYGNTGSSWDATDLNSSFKISLFSGVGVTFPGNFSSYSIGLGLHYAYSTMNVPLSLGSVRSASYDAGQQDFGIGLMTSVNLFNNKALGMFIAVNYAYDFLNWVDNSSLPGGYKLLQTEDTDFNAVSGGTIEVIVGLNLNTAVMLKQATSKKA